MNVLALCALISDTFCFRNEMLYSTKTQAQLTRNVNKSQSSQNCPKGQNKLSRLQSN